MTNIQIILLFTTMENLPAPKQSRLKEIVCEEYCRYYNCNPESVHTALFDGKNSSPSNIDILLSIASEQTAVNEGALRGKMKQAIANRLGVFFPKSMGFSGNIATKDGKLEIPTPKNTQDDSSENENDYVKRAQNYQSFEPSCSFDMLKLPSFTMEQIEQALARIEYEHDVFENWGLYAIMPNPISAMSFFGAPGTGKTMAAEAIAHKINKNIIRASYADIESKYHGEGPKNVSSLFLAAEQQNAVLFIDEADSLLSKRLTNVSQGSEQAINSMRSQLLICLEKFHGIVIFATNLVVNYDRAFISRLINIEFELPDAEMRNKIWKAHLYPTAQAKIKLNIPLAADVDIDILASDYPACGRDIRNAVVNACVETRRKNLPQVTQSCLVNAISAEIQRHNDVASAEDHTELRSAQQDDSNLPKQIIAQSLNNILAQKK